MTPYLPFDAVSEEPRPLEVPTRKPANPVAEEKARLNAAALRVLAYLQERGSALNWEMSTPEIGGSRAPARCHELKQDGWDIRVERVSKGTFRYTLVGRKEW